MKAVFSYAKSQGLIIRSPAQAINGQRIPPSRIQVPSVAQFAELVAGIRASDGRPSSKAVAKDGVDLVERLDHNPRIIVALAGRAELLRPENRRPVPSSSSRNPRVTLGR